MTVDMQHQNATFAIEPRPLSLIHSSVSRLRTSIQAWIRWHIVAQDPSPDLFHLDQMDRIRRGPPSPARIDNAGMGLGKLHEPARI